MATKSTQPQTFVERCDACDDDTRHEVSIALVTESKKPTNAEFSREPYRVTRCTECGLERQTRMNNA